MSRTADEEQQQQQKILPQELDFQKKKSNEYFKRALVLSCSLSSCHRAHLDCQVELVSLDLLERRSALATTENVPVNIMAVVCVGFYLTKCSLSTRARTEKLETLAQLEKQALA